MPLSHDEARAFYDRFGTKQDWQRFYEDRAIVDLIEHAGLDQAQWVVEFGCGTGRLAEILLAQYLPPTSHYTALDISGTMVALAQKRLARFGPRVEVHLTHGDMKLDLDAGAYDRFLATYVLDLLAESDIRALLAEAHRVLMPGGMLGVVSLTHGSGFVSRLVEKAWMAVYSIRPGWVGGCRPTSLTSFIKNEDWQMLHQAHIVQCALASEVVIAARRA